MPIRITDTATMPEKLPRMEDGVDHGVPRTVVIRTADSKRRLEHHRGHQVWAGVVMGVRYQRAMWYFYDDRGGREEMGKAVHRGALKKAQQDDMVARMRQLFDCPQLSADALSLRRTTIIHYE